MTHHERGVITWRRGREDAGQVVHAGSIGLAHDAGDDAAPEVALLLSRHGAGPPLSGADVIGLDDLRFVTSAISVPKASTAVSFGLLMALGLGGVVLAAKRKKAGAVA